ncbi:MAG: glutamine synthetase family protein [Burkholderiaceae bacterium]
MTDEKVMNFNDLEQWLNERRVTEVECLVPDLTGVARGKILPRAKFTEDRGMRLPEAIVAMGVTGEFHESGPYYDVIDPTDKDMQLRPDPSTVRIVPWATDPTAQVIHDCSDHDGKLVPFAPRSVLRRICELFAAEGLRPIVAPELEFYLTEAFMHYVGGLQRYIPAAMVLVAPYVNSYRRLSRNTAAPVNIEWGFDNRTVGIRSPISEPQARRVENRVIGADANPYVALAMTLACGYLGLKNQIKPRPQMKGDAYLSPYSLPRSLGEALDWLRKESDLHEVLGKEFITVYSEIKELEFDEFMKVISPWEREHLLLHV